MLSEPSRVPMTRANTCRFFEPTRTAGKRPAQPTRAPNTCQHAAPITRNRCPLGARYVMARSATHASPARRRWTTGRTDRHMLKRTQAVSSAVAHLLAHAGEQFR